MNVQNARELACWRAKPAPRLTDQASFRSLLLLSISNSGQRAEQQGARERTGNQSGQQEAFGAAKSAKQARSVTADVDSSGPRCNDEVPPPDCTPLHSAPGTKATSGPQL